MRTFSKMVWNASGAEGGFFTFFPHYRRPHTIPNRGMNRQVQDFCESQSHNLRYPYITCGGQQHRCLLQSHSFFSLVPNIGPSHSAGGGGGGQSTKAATTPTSGKGTQDEKYSRGAICSGVNEQVLEPLKKRCTRDRWMGFHTSSTTEAPRLAAAPFSLPPQTTDGCYYTKRFRDDFE